jgi:hypothetical protein
VPLISTIGGGSARGFGRILSGEASPVLTHLQLFYDFNNPASYSGSGSTVNDISGNGRNGSINGSPTFITSPTKGLDFNASAGNQDISFSNPVDFNANWTAEFWLTPVDFGGWDWIMNMSGYTPGVSLTVNASQPRWSYGTWFTEGVTGTRPTLTLGQHYQIVFQKSGSNGLTYVNGSQIGNTTPLSGSVSNSTCFISRGPANSDRNGGNIFIARIYNSALSAPNILQNFNANRGRFGI